MRITRLASALLLTSAMTMPAFAQDEMLITEEPLELTIHMHWPRAQRYDENYPVETAAREMTNIHLKDATSGSNSTDSLEAFNLMLAAGDLPDIVGGHLIKNPVNQYGPEGAFLPLNDLIEEHAPNIKAFFDDHPDVLAAASAADGNLYYIPYLPDGKYARAYWIRQDWLDALGLEQPQNVDELYAVLTAFRNDDPNGNGLKDEIPFFTGNWEEFPRLVTLWGGRTSGSDTYHDFYVEDGVVRHGYVEEGYREGIKNLAQWYKEGLIDPEVFTRGSSARDQLLGSNVGGMTHDWFASTGGYNDAMKDRIEGFSLKAFPPPESTTGVRLEEHRRTALKPDGWSISYTNEHPVETIKYFDFWFTPEGRNLSNFGVEGEQWDMVDGVPTFKPEVLNSDTPVNSQLWQVGAQIQRGFWMDYRYEEQWTNPVALEGIALYDEGDYLIEEFLGVAFNEEEQAVYDKYWAGLRSYMLERQQAWLLGTGDVELDWERYLADLDRMGFNQVVEVMNSAYQRQYGG